MDPTRIWREGSLTSVSFSMSVFFNQRLPRPSRHLRR